MMSTEERMLKDHEKIIAEIAQLIAESANLNRETKLMPFKVLAYVVATFTAAYFVVAKLQAVAPIAT